MAASRLPTTDPRARWFLGVIFAGLSAVGLASALLPHHEDQPYLVPLGGVALVAGIAAGLLRHPDRPLRPAVVHALVAVPAPLVALVLFHQRDTPAHVEAGVFFVAAGLIAAIAVNERRGLVGHLAWIVAWTAFAIVVSAQPAPLWNLVTVAGVTVGISVVASYLRSRERAALVRHQTFTDESADGLCIVGADMRLLDANPAFWRTLGAEPWDPAIRHIPDWEARLTHAELVPLVARTLREPARFETLHRRVDGGTTPVEVVTRPVTWQGRPAIYCMVHDRTAARDALAAAHRHRRELQTVLAGIDHGVLLHDDSGRITYANPTAAELLGPSEGDLVGLHTDTLLSDAVDGEGVALGRDFTPIGATLRLGHGAVHRELGVRVGAEVRWVRLSTAAVGDDPTTPVGVVCSVTDVAPEREHRDALRRSEQRFRTLAEQSPLPIHLMRPDGTFAYVNPAFEALCGHSGEALATVRGHDLIHPDDLRQVQRALRRLAVIGGSTTIEHRIVRRDGTERAVRSDIAVLPERPLRFVCTVTDLSELYRLRDRLTHDATHDPLTGLANRALAEDRLAAALSRASRGPNLPVVLFVDLDRFKEVNDTLGHAAGDEVLVTVADRVRRCVRAEDLVARLGGDELLVLLDSTHRPRRADVDSLAHKILGAIGVPMALADGHVVSITASIGVALGAPDRSPSDLVAAADGAGYRAKAAGRACVMWADAVPG
ncbi:MAG TPA: diguanylate cyclase [Acidimicrobiales bacterium]|nr:diguanylate cyclase [Acidimicrobiales bacterium]